MFSPREYTVRSFEAGNFVYHEKDAATTAVPSTDIEPEVTPEAPPESLTPIMPSVLALEDEAQSSMAQITTMAQTLPRTWDEVLERVAEEERRRSAELASLSDDDLTPYFAGATVVLAYARGGTSWVDPAEMDFKITEQQMQGVKIWAQRIDNPQYVLCSQSLSSC